MSETPVVLKPEQYYAELGDYRFRMHLSTVGWSVIRCANKNSMWIPPLSEKLVICGMDGLTVKWVRLLQREDHPSTVLYIPPGEQEVENIAHMLRKYGSVPLAD